MTTVSASQLRQDVYRLLDQVLETGEPLEIRRKGRTLRVVADRPASKFDRLQPRPDLITGDAGDLVDIEWSASWDADRTLAP